jgi:hypothetical protein
MPEYVPFEKVEAANENDIVLDSEGYLCRCVVCGQKAQGDSDGPPFRTFSLGYDASSLFVSGVIVLCPEHEAIEDPLDMLLRRIEQILGRKNA